MDLFKLDSYFNQGDDSLVLDDSQERLKLSDPGENVDDFPNICENFTVDDDTDKFENDSESEEDLSTAKSGEPVDSDDEKPLSALVPVDLTEHLRQLDEITNVESKKRTKAAAKKSPKVKNPPKTKKLTKAQQKKLEQQSIQNALKRMRDAIKNVPHPNAAIVPSQASTSTPTSAVETVNETHTNNNENKKGNKKRKKTIRIAPTRSSPRFSTRRRRNFLGTDIVDQSTPIEVIDLVKSPPLVLPGVVNLDSEDEDMEKGKTNLTDSFDEVNYKVSVKVRWMGDIERFPTKQFEPFRSLMEKLAKRENATLDQVILSNEDQIIQPDDTPNSIGYRISTILTGRIMAKSELSSDKKPKRNKNIISIKIQSMALKRPLEIEVDKTKDFYNVQFKCAEALGVPAEKLRLEFDGESIEMNTTPNDLDFEGGEIVDCHVTK